MALPKFFRSRKAKIIGGVVLVLIALRIALPYIVLHFANKRLAAMDGYYGHIKDIDIALLRGAYVIDSLYINKVNPDNNRQSEFISARSIDLSVEWKAIFKGKIVGELVFDRPVMRFVEDKVELSEVSQDTADFRDLLNDFMPIKVNRAEIRNGVLQYADYTASPAVDVAATQLNLVALNLRNAYKSTEILPASIEADGRVYEGTLRLSMRLNPLADDPTFDLNAALENTNLAALNDMFKAYGGFDVNKGRFSMYTEAATKDRRFTGYVKPLIDELDVAAWKTQDKRDNFFQKVWESVVGGAGELLENQRKDQVATRISFSGSIDQPRPNIFRTVVLVLQNAFVRALKPSIENRINLAKIGDDEKKREGFFKELFAPEKDDKPKKKKKV